MSWIESSERMLKIPPETPTEFLIRYRAIWVVSVLFLAVQGLNLITMTINYRRLTYDHAVAVGSMAVVLSMMIMLRWFKAYHVYALMFSVLVFAGISGSALPQHMGINSALIPLVIVGPLINGYISGRLAAILFWVTSCVFLTFMYWVSISNPSIMLNGTHRLELNRFTNAIYYLTISTSLSVMLTEYTFSAIKKMRENAERATKAEAAKSEFLAKMSHELRTPLNGVIGLTDALLQRDLPARERELAMTIRTSGNSLLLILNDLLDLSKIEAGKMTISPRPVNVRDAINGAVQGWHEVAEARDLKFSVEISPALDQGGSLDELRLRQIIHNLLSNAMKFTDEGYVAIEAKRTEDSTGAPQLVIRVGDTGRGISTEAVSRIFDSFEQEVQADVLKQTTGTGLGLPISRMLVELMGGSIDLERTGPKGSIFRAVIPFTPAELQDKQEDTAEESPVAPGLRVLIVEDHEINKLVLSEFLKILDVPFELATDGVECLERLEASRFDVILMDKNMPRMNGIAKADAIRKSDKPYKNIWIIALTADAMVGERERLLAGGMDGYLSKPLRIEELATALSQVRAK